VRGLVLRRVRDITLATDLPDPTIEAPGDAVVAVRAAGLCGSDLHPYEGREPARTGVVQGHEAVGEVVAIGPAVRTVTVGERVLVPFTTSCGRCPPCTRGLTARCVHGELFGWGDPDRPDVAALHGGQAELLRVPLADTTLVRVPARVDDVAALLLTDNLPTAWEAVERTGLGTGEPLVVVGLGSVGLCAVVAARALGAGPVLAVDPLPDRRERARRLGADVVTTPEAAAATLAALLEAGAQDAGRTGAPASGRAPCIVEAAGTHGAQRLAFELLAPGGTLSVIAVQTDERFAFTPAEAYDRNATVRAGRASVRATLERLLPRIEAGHVPIPAAACVTHRDVPLAAGPEHYRRFAAREPGLVKVAFRP
jgi:alcohol dehydrogenase